MAVEDLYFISDERVNWDNKEGVGALVYPLKLNIEAKALLNIETDNDYEVLVNNDLNMKFTHENKEFTLPPPIIVLNRQEFYFGEGKDIELVKIHEIIEESVTNIHIAKISERLFNEIKPKLNQEQLADIKNHQDNLYYTVYINNAPYDMKNKQSPLIEMAIVAPVYPDVNNKSLYRILDTFKHDDNILINHNDFTFKSNLDTNDIKVKNIIKNNLRIQ